MIPAWGIYAGGALLLTFAGFASGWQVRTWKADSDELKTVEAAIERGKEQQELADFRAGRYEEQRDESLAGMLGRDTEIRTIYRTEQVEVPAECEPPVSALLVLDEAIRVADAQVAGEPVAAVPED